MIVPFFLSNFFVAIFAMTVASTPGRNSLLSTEQNHHVMRTHDTYGTSPIRGQRQSPTNKFRKCIFNTICDIDGSFKTWFQCTISIILFLDIIYSLSAPTYSANGAHTWYYTEYVFNVSIGNVIRWMLFSLYFIEIILKILALGLMTYYKSKLNVFDSFIICLVFFLGLLEVFELIPRDSPLHTGVLKFRYFHLITHVLPTLKLCVKKSHRSIYKIQSVIRHSYQSISNIVELWFVITLIYSAIGVSMFARSSIQLKRARQISSLYYNSGAFNHTNVNHYYYSQVTYGLNDHSNFDDIFHSFFSLLRISTYDHWSELYKSCIDLLDSDNTTYHVITSLYFVSYILVTGPILKALAISVLYSQFVRLKNENEKMLNEKDKSIFQTVWLKYDPKGIGYIPMKTLSSFLMDIRKFELINLLKYNEKNKNPRQTLMEQLKYTSSARGQDEQESLKGYSNRMLVPHESDIWFNGIVTELTPHARLISDKSLMKVEWNFLKENNMLDDSQMKHEVPKVSCISFSRVLVLLVQKRLHEQASKLQKNFEFNKSNTTYHDKSEAARCPVCKLQETAYFELAQLMKNKESAEKELSKDEHEVLVSGGTSSERYHARKSVAF